MESYQIISAFSEIKSELRTRHVKIHSNQDLRLWFTFSDGVLYAHDYNNHNYSIALAIFEADEWKLRMKSGSYAYQLVHDAITYNSSENLVKFLESLYDQYGYFILRIF